MINKVGFSNGFYTNFQGNTNLLEKFKSEIQIQHPENINLNGSDALANYNKPLVDTPSKEEIKVDENVTSVDTKTNVEGIITKVPYEYIIKDLPEPIVLKGNEIETLSGERILNSEGELDKIKVKGDNTTKEYSIYKNNITSISEFDNNTGIVLRKDSFGTEFSKNTSDFITEFSSETGEVIKKSFFVDGNMEMCTFQDKQNDRIIRNHFTGKGKLGYIVVNDTKTGTAKSFNIDEEKNINYIWERDGSENDKKDISIKNGKVDKITTFDYKPLKNIYGITPDNITLKPSEFIEKPDVAAIKGDKIFRADGSLEKIISKDENKTVTFNMTSSGKFVESIEEKENNNLIKSTIFESDGEVAIKDFTNGKLSKITHYKDEKHPVSVSEYDNENNLTKEITYSFDGSYINEYIDKTNPDIGNLRLQFDKDKNLIKAEINNKKEIVEDFSEKNEQI